MTRKLEKPVLLSLLLVVAVFSGKTAWAGASTPVGVKQLDLVISACAGESLKGDFLAGTKTLTRELKMYRGLEIGEKAGWGLTGTWLVATIVFSEQLSRMPVVKVKRWVGAGMACALVSTGIAFVRARMYGEGGAFWCIPAGDDRFDPLRQKIERNHQSTLKALNLLFREATFVDQATGKKAAGPRTIDNYYRGPDGYVAYMNLEQDPGQPGELVQKDKLVFGLNSIEVVPVTRKGGGYFAVTSQGKTLVCTKLPPRAVFLKYYRLGYDDFIRCYLAK